jgi:cytochrome c biogenesis protein CcdA/thiol-disulfide isomerase/thioredoxin
MIPRFRVRISVDGAWGVILLVVVGLVAGVVTSLSPCVLPVLPVILTAGVPGKDARTARRTDPNGASAAAADGVGGAPARTRSWRPYAVVGGLVLSFSGSVLFGSVLLSALRLPQNLLRVFGVVVLVVIGLGLIWPRLGDLLERPFARLPGRRVDPGGNGFVLGLGLGLLFVPCAGPVLAAIAVVGAAHQVGLGVLLLTASFGVGVGLPLLALALAGQALTQRTGAVRRHARGLRLASGVVLVVVAALIGADLTDGVARLVPGYADALQRAVVGSPEAAGRLRALSEGARAPTPDRPAVPADASCAEGADSLVNCGSAPELTGIEGWLNTPGGVPLSLAGLRGRVVLIDFWTYSCINCQRTLPHVQAWDRAYRDAGLTVIGVHTPEFAFEHVPANIAGQARALGVHYPVAIDNDYGTWNAYHNRYWPAEYLIDPAGVIRHVSFGEGGYAETEELIRQLLAERDPTAAAAAAAPPVELAGAVPDTTPTTGLTPETYLGYQYAPLHLSGPAPTPDRPALYRYPVRLDADTVALAGTWTAGPEAVTAGPDARLELSYRADRVYLVLAGQGSVTVRADGQEVSTVAVSGVPRLYPLRSAPGATRTVLELSVSPGVQAYDFTFG